MHNIQVKILAKLLYAESLGYAQLRPEAIESNHFAYHLEQLVRTGLVLKRGKQYVLSPSGLAYVDRISHEKMAPRLQPHIATAIRITNSEGKTLLFQRRFQPYIHRWGLPLGKTHFNETVAQSAMRELQEKTGLCDIPLTHRGVIYAQTSKDSFVISKILAHIFEGKVDGEPPLHANKRGNCAWATTAAFDDAELLPWLHDVEELLSKTPVEQLFFKEIFTEIF